MPSSLFPAWPARRRGRWWGSIPSTPTTWAGAATSASPVTPWTGTGGENTYRVGDQPTAGYVIDEFLFVLRITEDGGFELTLASADGNDTAVSGTWEYDGDGILLLTDDGQEIGAVIDGDPKTGGTVTLTIGGITVILSSDDPEMAEAAGRTELYCERVTVAGIYLGDELMVGTDPGMVPVRA